MDKKHILSEIRRTAERNGGSPLGIDLFKKATGIGREDWLGIHWAKWSDALAEAGFEPNRFGRDALDEHFILDKVALLARTLGRFPTRPEYRLQKRKDPNFPSAPTIRRRLGVKSDQVSVLKAFCASRADLKDVFSICEREEADLPSNSPRALDGQVGPEWGQVYLLKHDNAYKIGRSMDASQRYKDIRVQMPHETEEIHVIDTDDPVGIEAYWHNRFRDKRLKGEWFRLDLRDVRAFKKRKFM